jgi:hypothetical protein
MPPWGGVYWQYPVNNWGPLPGKNIEPGATRVTFYAAGNKGGEVVDFLAGGIVGGPCPDFPAVHLIVSLTTTMTQYSIDLSGITYTSVIGAFAWAAGPGLTVPPDGDAGPPSGSDAAGDSADEASQMNVPEAGLTSADGSSDAGVSLDPIVFSLADIRWEK